MPDYKIIHRTVLITVESKWNSKQRNCAYFTLVNIISKIEDACSMLKWIQIKEEEKLIAQVYTCTSETFVKQNNNDILQ